MSHNFARGACRQIVIIISTILIPVSLLFAVFSFLIPSLILRLIVRATARVFHRDLAGFVCGKQALTALEANYELSNVTILVHLIFDGLLSADSIRLAFQEKILKKNDCDNYAILQQTWTQFLGFLFWKWDKNFNLNHHIRNYDYEDNGLALPDLCTEADLQRVTADLIAESYKEGKSPWEILVIQNYRAADNTSGKGQTAVAFRFHHALLDGYSMMELWFKLFNVEGVEVRRPNFPQLSLTRRVWKGVVLPMRFIYDAVSQFVDGFDWSDNNKSSWRLSDKKKSARKYHTFFSDRFPVSQIKEIKNKYGVSYNVAVYSVAIGAVRRLMMEAGQEIPTSMSCSVPVPLPKRSQGLAIEVATTWFSFSPRLQFPAQRIGQICKRTRFFYDAPAVPMLLSWFAEFQALLPVVIIQFVYNQTRIPMMMTSFPGPERELDTMGATKWVDMISALSLPPCCFGKNVGNIKYVYFTVNPRGVMKSSKFDGENDSNWNNVSGAVGIFLSMAGKQRFVLTVDQAIFQSYTVPVNFARHFEDEIQDYLLSTDEFSVVSVA